MKRILSTAIIIFSALCLSACASTPDPGTASVTSIPDDTVAIAGPSKTPPRAMLLDKDIPDAKVISRLPSDRDMYEDKNSIYFYTMSNNGSTNAVYAIHKKTHAVDKILDECATYTWDKGMIYWVPYSNSDKNVFNEVWTYNTATGQNVKTATLPYNIYELFTDGKTMYLCLDTRKPDRADRSSLYSMDLDGNHLKKILQEASSIQTIGGKIYHTEPYGAEGDYIYEYNEKTKRSRQITSYIAEWDAYETISGRIYYYNEESFVSQDLASGKQRVICRNIDRDFTFSRYGQYILYVAKDGASMILTALDTDTGKTYRAADVTSLYSLAGDEGYIWLGTTQDNAYINITYPDGTFSINQITIDNGLAKIRQTAELIQ